MFGKPLSHGKQFFLRLGRIFGLGKPLDQFLEVFDSVPGGGTILADITARPALALTMLAGFACGVAAFVTGLVAILKWKDRTILAFASTIVGGLFVLFLIAELAFPH